MTIRHYDHRHETVQQVRECDRDSAALGVTPAVHETNGQPTLPGFVTHPASATSLAWLRDLMRDRDDSGVQVGRVLETLMDVMDGKQVSQREVSDAITVLVKCPLKGKTNREVKRAWDPMPDVPAGRYCLEQDGVLKFYQVDRPTEGKWAGWVFTKQLIGAPGDYRRIRLNKQQARPVLEAISRDVKGALRRYGLEHKVCGVCSSPLTKKESLDYGIGPVCRAKGGW